MRIILATSNQHKTEEIKAMVKDLDIEIVSLKDLHDSDDVPETGTTFSENAYLKAKHFHDKYNCAVIADDSGLVVPSIGNKPGVYSARFAGEHANDALNNQKLLADMNKVLDRKAYFNCSICYIDRDVYYFDGQIHGEIAFDLKGKHGFGYDPLFILYNGKRLAEIPIEEKNLISHRAQAFKKWHKFMIEKRC